MIDVAIIDQGTIDTTLPVVGDSNYQQAALSLFIRQQFAALKAGGVSFKVSESSDFTTFDSEMLTGVDNFETRLDEILSTGASSVIAALPDVTPIIAALLAGGGGAVIPILLKGVCDVMLRHMNSRTTSAGGDYAGEIDLTDLIAKLDSIDGKLKNSTSESIAQILEDALITTNVSEERYALIWNLINQAIRIIVENNNQYSDVTLEDSS